MSGAGVGTIVTAVLNDSNTAKSLVKTLEDIAHNKASIDEELATGLTIAEAVAKFVPGAQEVVFALEAAQVLAALYEALPSNWQMKLVSTGPVRDLFDDKVSTPRVFGYERD